AGFGKLAGRLRMTELYEQTQQAHQSCASHVVHVLFNDGRRYCPVWLPGSSAILSGGPAPTISPPSSPPSGPRSMIQSAHLIISKLCSITITVLPALRSFIRTCSSFSISAKCNPVVGSS